MQGAFPRSASNLQGIPDWPPGPLLPLGLGLPSVAFQGPHLCGQPLEDGDQFYPLDVAGHGQAVCRLFWQVLQGFLQSPEPLHDASVHREFYGCAPDNRPRCLLPFAKEHSRASHPIFSLKFPEGHHVLCRASLAVHVVICRHRYCSHPVAQAMQ